MIDLALATCDRALAPEDGAPEWVQLLPEGRMKGRDGREFDLIDPGALVLAFQSGGIDLPIDYEHANDKPEAKLGGPVPAAGWIKELRADAGGLWGRVEWTAAARAMITRKEYRYLSPSFLFHPKTRQIVRLKGAGLVHSPNLHLTALNSQETAMPLPNPQQPNLTAALAKLLGLPEDTPADELLAQLEARLKAEPDPAKYMPVGAVQEMLADRNSERSSVAEGRSQEKVNAALRGGYISNGMRQWALALCASNEAAFDDFMASTGPTFAYLSKPSHATGLPPAAARCNDSEAGAAVCAQLGLKPDALKG